MERIRQLRKERGLSQARLAVMADMDPATLNRLERGTGNPNLRTLQRIADALDMSIAELVEDVSPKAQAPLPLDSPVAGAGDPAEAAKMIGALAGTAAGLASAWNQDVEFYEQHGRSLLPDRTLEMGLAVEALYQHFWGALSVLQRYAESLDADPDPATWEPQSKELLIEAGSNIRALAELYALINRAATEADTDTGDFQAMREEFNMAPPAFLSEDPQWPEAMEKARAAAGIA